MAFDTKVDHINIIVTDLAAGVAAWEALLGHKAHPQELHESLGYVSADIILPDGNNISLLEPYQPETNDMGKTVKGHIDRKGELSLLQKAFYKAELHMARQLGRLKRHLHSAIKLLESRLAEVKRIGFDGGLVTTTCTLAALHEASGNTERAELLLSELAHFRTDEVKKELDEARLQVTPYTASTWGWRTLAAMRRTG